MTESELDRMRMIDEWQAERDKPCPYFRSPQPEDSPHTLPQIAEEFSKFWKRKKRA